mmetsp:Transcript_81804/g.128824  ORF Transcript_81804/g.128824 Transcript_81804/m.128824 type:complete len:467 (+) Transcript_81804:92-1492(+)
MSHWQTKQQWQVAENTTWEAYVQFERNRSLKVHMSGWEFRDVDMQRWCKWFASQLKAREVASDAQPLVAKEIDFSYNMLTSAGVQHLMRVLQQHSIAVRIFKFHHNCIEDGSDLASFLERSCGSLREIHLSHNRLENSAAAQIVLAAAGARDETGAFCYPTSLKKGCLSLWLRLEQNFLDEESLRNMLHPSIQQLGRSQEDALCSTGLGSTPQFHASGCGGAPAVQAKNLAMQRSQSTTEVVLQDSSKQSWKAKAAQLIDGCSDEACDGLNSYSRSALLAVHSLLESRQLLKLESGIGLRTQNTQQKFSFNPSAVEFIPIPAAACISTEADDKVLSTSSVTDSIQTTSSFNPQAVEFVPNEAFPPESVLLAVPAPHLAGDHVEEPIGKPSEASLKECDSCPGSARTSAGDNEANLSSPDDEEDEISEGTPVGKASGYLLDWGPATHVFWHPTDFQVPAVGERPPPR